MLSLLGKSHRFCDGVSRRSFLQLGGLAVGGLSLSQLLQLE
ncbi:MAG TPA: twin-arginine translocation signal domain-containing protein, partial [Pirellulaceae bacterium]|nr:twin-arginine translocation signal domain-containing protein [Pirellulaceae bacterium]